MKFAILDKKVKPEDSMLLFVHQLKSEITATKWSLAMILKGDFGQITEKQKNVLENIIKKNESLISLANKLLTGAKTERKLYAYNQKAVNMEDIIESIISSSLEEIKKNNINLDFTKSPQPPPQIMVDEGMIKLALQNIFENAVKYTLPGGAIKISLVSDKKNIEISMKDSGIGISEKQKNKLFNKFFRGANAVKMDSAGSGLGLFIAKNIIEAHQGKIWFQSQENKGSTFYVSLPIL
jgi:signal transduction histidine kinase